MEDALTHRAQLLVAASYYGSVVLGKLSSAPALGAEPVRTQFSAQLLSATAALPAVLFIACLQHAPTALSPASLPAAPLWTLHQVEENAPLAPLPLS